MKLPALPRGVYRNAELSVARSPPSLKLRRALLAIHPRSSERGILAKDSNHCWIASPLLTTSPDPMPPTSPIFFVATFRIETHAFQG